MGLEIVQPHTCLRGCCSSDLIPVHLSSSSYSVFSPIARGAESVVYEGWLNEKLISVKKPILSTSEDIDKFHKELQLLCKLDHPGLAKLVAAHSKPPNYMLFFQFYESQNLAEKLHGAEWSPRIDQVLMISLKLAEALQYLHSLGIVHRDVKPANILLDENLCPHLTDFGLAESKENLKKVNMANWRSSGKPTGGFHKKNMVGTLIYMAPEILRRELHTEKSDVYSFGVSVNELLTGVVPYTNIQAEAQAHTVLEMNYTEQQLTSAVVSDGLRPILAGPEFGAPASLLFLIQRCWDDNPEKRPSFADVVSVLSLLLEHSVQVEKEKMAPNKSLVSQENQIIRAVNQENVNWLARGKSFYKRATVVTDSAIRPWLDSSNDHVANHPILSWGSFATCGRREAMEDAHVLMPHMFNEKDIHLFGIFDGHRGAAAAEFSTQALPAFLQMFSSLSSPSDALVEAFLKTDLAFLDELNAHRKAGSIINKDYHPGCTAVVALIVENKLFVANAGDCRAILCRAGRPFSLTRDHLASCPEERERVIDAGGEVKWQVDTWRVGPAALQVTRSIGDDDLKPAVTAKPEVTETLLSAEDEFVILASDGLWDALSGGDVISIISATVKEAEMCSKRLAAAAVERGSSDNVTVIIVFLRPVSTAERVY